MSEMRPALRYPASAASITALLVLTVVFWWTGTLAPQEPPAWARSSLQITGMALMLILLPAYLLAAVFVMSRRSLDLVDQLRPRLDPARADAAADAIRDAARTSWPVGVAVGVALGLFNVDFSGNSDSPTLGIEASLIFGQLFLWLMVGLLGSTRIRAARAFSRLGKVVDFDLFHLDRLKPLARSGMIDVVVIAVGLAMTPLQALDAEFHWYNYRFALIVLTPSALFLLLWPLLSIHRRIRPEKQRQLAHVDALIGDAEGAATREEILGLETLLAHRDRLTEQRTWPVSSGLLSRLFLYLIIPPIAWAGAAVVETLVSQMIGS
jgi:hypothetical protein